MGAFLKALCTAYDRFPDPVSCVGRDFRVIYANPKTQSVHGVPPDEQRGGLVDDLVPDISPHIERTLRTGLAYQQDIHRIGKLWHVSRHPVTDRRGRVRAVISTIKELVPKPASLLIRAVIDHAPRWQVLSQREQQVAALVWAGLTTRHIATELGISTHTVSAHRRRIRALLRITTPSLRAGLRGAGAPGGWAL